MKKFALLAVIFALTCLGAKTIDDAKFGLRGDLNNDDLKARDIEWKKANPGESTLLERSYENAPAFIPHDIEEFLPITIDNNMCVSCHMPEFAEGMGATPVPATHLMAMASGKYLDGALSQERFNCTACHVTQADAKPLVKNNFKAEFRNKEGKKRSNLAEVLHQGEQTTKLK